MPLRAHVAFAVPDQALDCNFSTKVIEGNLQCRHQAVGLVHYGTAVQTDPSPLSSPACGPTLLSAPPLPAWRWADPCYCWPHTRYLRSYGGTPDILQAAQTGQLCTCVGQTNTPKSSQQISPVIMGIQQEGCRVAMSRPTF